MPTSGDRPLIIIIITYKIPHAVQEPQSIKRLPISHPSIVILLVSAENGTYHPHPPSPLLLFLSPYSDTHFYRLTIGEKLSRPRHCSKGAQPVSKAVRTSQWLSR